MVSCGLEGPLVNVITRDPSTFLPLAADTVVVGRVAGVPDGAALSISAYSGAGSVVEGVDPRCRHAGPGGETVEDAGACPDGTFALRFRGNTELRGVRLVATWSGGQAWGILPLAPKRLSVLDPEQVVDLAVDVPALSPMSGRSTTIALVITGSVLSQGRTLASLPPDTLRQTADALDALLASGNEAVAAFDALVADLLGRMPGTGKPAFAGALPQGAGVADLADADALAAAGVTAEAFEQKLLAAAAEVQVAVCYDRATIRVVFQADLRGGALDGNCKPVETFKWAKDLPGKTVFLAAGVHKDTVVCGAGVAKPYCLDPAEVDAANAALGNWVPNQVAMTDDGTGGDEVKGDRIYTLVLDLPFVPIDESSPTGAGVRVGYKYTYGTPGQGWTDSEEWPGNQRLLELVDVSGDGLVVRRDAFGDEASNKDKANALTPANGGCGLNFWESAVKAKCGHDTREAEVDTGGDCKPDAWPSPGPVAPLTVPCS
jgi:hypothetical protein